MYIMSVSENGAYTAYRKNSKKNHGNVEISGRWEHDKTIGFWNSLIKTNQNPNKYPLVMTKLISLLLKPWPIEL